MARYVQKNEWSPMPGKVMAYKTGTAPPLTYGTMSASASTGITLVEWQKSLLYKKYPVRTPLEWLEDQLYSVMKQAWT